MHIECYKDKKITLVRVNNYKPIIKFNFSESNFSKVKGDEINFKGNKIKFERYDNSIVISKDLQIKEHLLGLGENTFNLDKRRTKLSLWNTDSYNYHRYTDHLYVSIPFLISVSNKGKFGIFVNYTGRIEFDNGIKEYNKMQIAVNSKSFDVFLIEGNSIKEIIRNFVELTGKPFKIPKWALGHSISRYTYFPQETVVDVLKEYKKYTEVDAIYLDIDYMDKYQIFEWNKNHFPRPEKLINSLHKLKTKVVTILDPTLRVDQNYKLFKEGLGNYCENPDGSLYISKMWAGQCVYPDFLNKNVREWWGKLIKNWVNTYKIDGIWLDMNEPSAFNENRTLDSNVLHKIDNKRVARHEEVHNAYAYFEAMATYDALKEPFILSRSGYAGIQKYAAIWSGDSTSTWEDMSLQIPLLLNLSISGVPYVGCDIGGFNGRSDQDLLVAYYKMAVFFPIFRNHKNKLENDQEIYTLDDKHKEEIKKVIEIRYLFMDYIIELAENAHKNGDPIIRPLLYEFESDENTYNVNDEYMLGSKILYAPLLEKNIDKRDIYLPIGDWMEFSIKKEFHGPCYIKSETNMPIFIRKGSKIKLTDGRVLTY